jgi:hypothetical protein
MKISKLLELHSNELIGLEKSFGDSFLLKQNRIYRNIRTATLNAGFSFTTQNNEDYLALSLTQLENILKSKKIPYFDNVNALVKLEQQHPQVGSWDDIFENLRRNFHFHESCHAVARNLQLTAFKDLDDDILLRLIEESFANTCELLAVVDAEKTADRIFFEINSYTALFELKELIQQLVDALGFEKLFSIVMLSYLHSNHLHNSLKEPLFKEILMASAANNLIENNISLQKKLNELLKYCFYLDENFRQVATGFYLKLSTKKQAQVNLKEKNYFTQILKDSGYLKFIKQLSSIATQT